MATKRTTATHIVVLGLIVLTWVAVFLWLGRQYDVIDLWGLMIIGAALLTLFGFLQMPAGLDADGAFRESHIRLAIAATLIVAYLVYFGSVVYLNPVGPDGKAVESFAKDLLPTLTNLLMVAISFYFGSTAAIEIAGALKKDHTESKGS